MLGERLETAVATRIEAVDGLNEADNSSRYKIVDFDLAWTSGVNTRGEKAYLRQMREDEIVP